MPRLEAEGVGAALIILAADYMYVHCANSKGCYTARTAFSITRLQTGSTGWKRKYAKQRW
jgi:hypothetical protein